MKIGVTERGDGGLDQSWRNSLDKVDGVVIITKAPQRLLDTDIPQRSIIHCTITGYGGTAIEPGVEEPKVTLKAYKKLVKKLGGERVVLRIDPIFPRWCDDKAVILSLLPEAKGRVRISFLDMYPHVAQRFKDKNLSVPHTTFHAPLGFRKKLFKEITKILGEKPEICGEPGFKCTGCVSSRDLKAMGFFSSLSGDKGYQRAECMCGAEKVELLKVRKPCGHKCIYCYWR